MKLLEYIFYGIITALIGIFSNLISTIWTETFFEINLLNTIATVVGVLSCIVIIAILKRGNERDVKKKLKQLQLEREQLYKLKNLYQSNEIWSSIHRSRWITHKDNINKIKIYLTSEGEEIPYEPIDDYPDPHVGFLTKTLEALRKIVIILWVVGPTFLALSVSKNVHGLYLYIKNETLPLPTPSLAPTPVPTSTVFEGLSEIEPNSSFSDANGPLLPNVNYTGTPNDEYDVFFFHLEITGTIAIEVAGHKVSSGQAGVYNLEDDEPVPLSPYDATPYDGYYLTYSNSPPRTYYLVIYNDITQPFEMNAIYTLRVFYPTNESDNIEEFFEGSIQGDNGSFQGFQTPMSYPIVRPTSFFTFPTPYPPPLPSATPAPYPKTFDIPPG